MSLRRQLALDEATEVGTEGSCISAEVGGWLALPTYKNNDIAYWFVNGRCVKDRMLSSAVRVAYQDVTIPGELPPFVLFLNVAAQEVDVNVHPTKTEVRFRRPAEIRSFVIRAIKVKLAGMSRRTPLGLSDKMFTDMSWDSTLRGGHFPHVYDEVYAIGEEPTAESSKSFEISCKEDIWLKNDKGNDFSQQTSHNDSQLPRRDFAFDAGNLALKENGSLPHEFAYQEDGPLPHEFAYPDDLNLGIAKAQLFSSYIISQNADSIFLVDQHAAHERIVFESIKNEVFIDEEGNIVSSLPVQKLLFPERIQLANVGLFQEYLPYLRKMGFGLAIIDPMPRSSKEAKARQDEGIASEHQECADLFSLEIQEVPQILSEANVVALLVRLVNELKDDEIGESFLRKVHKIFADYACHNSVRANHELSYDEMNAVLRLMETTERGGQCNHGRPSYVKITKQRIDNAFGRMHQATKSL
ncbi:MAG: hypothetical protein LBF72_00755 [Holosporales bacterium]|jgi:DNA mismatch repair protein MutL|nr:hypothetical protein [Holosporales bacterium]